MAARTALLRSHLADIFYILAGVLFSGFALQGFLVPNKFFDGGVTGISLLAHEFYHINIAWLIMGLNLPFILLGARLVGIPFALRTLGAVIAFGICLLVIPYPVITSDQLLVSIFGGVFLGIGAGLAMRGGASIDGIEVVALHTGRALAFTTSEIILGINICIFGVAAFALGLETALYSTLTYFAASRTANFVVDGIEEYTSVVIVSGESEEIKRLLAVDLRRGITVYKGERGFLPNSFESSHPVDIVSTIVTRLEVPRIRKAVREIDPKAFIVTSRAREAIGGVLQRRPRH